MISVEMEDVLAVLQLCKPYIIGIVAALVIGIVMFEMVTGRVPFDGDTTVAVALQHLQEEIARPSIYAPDLPISFDIIFYFFKFT